jgi:hypothetical protein
LRAGDVPLKPKLVLLDLAKAQPPEVVIHPEELELALEEARQRTGATGAAIALRTQAELYCCGSSGAAPPVGTRLDPETGLTGMCFRSGEALLCADTAEDLRVDAEACRALEVRSVLVVPLYSSGSACGVLELLSPHPAAFTESHIAAAREIADRLMRAEPQPRVAQEETGRDEQLSIFLADRLRQPQERHSPWSRTAIAAALIAAGVMGYGGRLRHSQSVLTAHAGATKTVGGPSDVVPPARVSIADDDINHTERRIQGSFSKSQLSAVRARVAAGDSSAAYDLAERYADGAGVPRDYRQAMIWFANAASKGNVSAQWKLGLGYLKGVGVSQDQNKAAEWLRRAANQGHIGAQLALSELYFSGVGVERDYVRAYTWATIAAQTTNENIQSMESIAERMTPEQLAEAKHRVTAWWQHRAKPLPR